MTNGGGPRYPEVLFAQASPRSVGGVSLFAAPRPVTAETVAGYFSVDQVAGEAVALLEDAGFAILQVSSVTVNVAAPPARYEEVFATRLVSLDRPVLKGFRRREPATFVDCPDTDVPGLIDPSRSPLGSVLEGVAIEQPVYFHGGPGAERPESPVPPTPAYWHLEVPGDVAGALGADGAHRQGVTGRGVQLVMCDTGWYRHPYFDRQHYGPVRVVLGPGATNAEVDPSGHGTGESANAFAVAPGVDLTMVKMNFVNPTGAFQAAAALRPDVISCSWGFDVTGPLSAAEQALAAAVAAAVAAGIVVVFSAGNCQQGFPAQHPDVIAAGGAYLEPDGRLRATRYASGFESLLYPGRRVPDVSGLVGDPPRAAYIVLPVPAGSEIDRDLGGREHPEGDGTKPDDGWAAFSGTSAAAPQVAGVAALLREARPGLPPARVRELLRAGARDVAAGAGCMGHEASPGADLATGAGLVDAARSLARARRKPAGAPTRRPAAISALVVLRTPESAEAGRAGVAGASEIARPHDVEAARAFFRTAGFEVTDVYGISFCITGRPTVFEATFGEAIAPEGTGPSTSVATSSGRLELRLDRLPEPVTRAVAAVTFSPPPAFGPTRY